MGIKFPGDLIYKGTGHSFRIAITLLSPHYETPPSSSCQIYLEPCDKLYLMQHVSQFILGQRLPKLAQPYCCFCCVLIILSWD